MYWERQQGGLCRKHALNAYFGYEKITNEMFETYCSDFDSYIKSKGYLENDVRRFDYVHSSRETLISYIIGRIDKLFCLHIPIGAYYDFPPLGSLINDDEFIFVYNSDHVYGYRKNKGAWYKIDSLSGITQSPLPNDPRLGYIIPRKDPRKDLYRLQETMKKYIDNPDMKDVEVPMAVSADIIGRLGDYSLCRSYYKFLQKYEKREQISRYEIFTQLQFFCSYKPPDI